MKRLRIKNARRVAAVGLAGVGLSLLLVLPPVFAETFDAVKGKQQEAFSSSVTSLQRAGVDTKRLDDYVEIGAFATYTGDGRVSNGYVIGVVPSAETGGYKVFSDKNGKTIKFSAGTKEETAFNDIYGHYAPRGYNDSSVSSKLGLDNTVLFDLTTPHGLDLPLEERIKPRDAAVHGDIKGLKEAIGKVKTYGSLSQIEAHMDGLSATHQTASKAVGFASIGASLATFALSRKKKNRKQLQVIEGGARSVGSPPNQKNLPAGFTGRR